MVHTSRSEGAKFRQKRVLRRKRSRLWHTTLCEAAYSRSAENHLPERKFEMRSTGVARGEEKVIVEGEGSARRR